MKDDIDAIIELRNRIGADLENFTSLLPIIITDNEEDKKMIDYAVDMVSTIKEELDNAEHSDDVKNLLNMRKLKRDYVRGNLPHNNQTICNDFVQDVSKKILEKYGFELDDGCVEKKE